jgi:hypothetical protein
MQGLMWFWVFYRAKQDGAALLVGLEGVYLCVVVGTWTSLGVGRGFHRVVVGVPVSLRWLPP